MKIVSIASLVGASLLILIGCGSDDAYVIDADVSADDREYEQQVLDEYNSPEYPRARAK